MTSATLLMLVVLGQPPAGEPQSLVASLGAPRYAERERATVALERLGRAALPALRSAREVKDLEIRTRAIALINKIEGALLTQPTQISLDFENLPLNEVIKSFSQQSGVMLTLIPDNSPQWGSRRVTIHEAAPLPFWKALDRLCDAARLQYNSGMYGVPQGRQPSFPLFDGGNRPQIPTFDNGPFRVSVMALHYQRDVTFPAGAPRLMQPVPAPRIELPGTVAPRFGPAVSEMFFAQLQVLGEPRLSVSQSGALKITEAIDEKGQPLQNAAARAGFAQRSSGYFGLNPGSVVQLQATLTRPEQPGKVIRKLRGSVPIMVTTRKPNPLTVKLEGAPGKTFRNDDIVVTISEIRPLGNTRQTTIDLSFRNLTGTTAPPSMGHPDFVLQQPGSFQQTIEVLDSQGRPMPWYQSSFDMESSRVSLTATPQTLDGNGAPAELRFYGLARASTEVEFEFSDLPLP